MITMGSIMDMKSGEMQARDVRAVMNALILIVSNEDKPCLNYCVNYAHYGMGLCSDLINNRPILGEMDKEKFHELVVQLLYVLNNMTSWRGDEAKKVRETLKAFGKKYKGK